MVPNCYKSHFNDFDEELYRKLLLAFIGHVSMLLIGSCKGNGPGSHRSYFDDFDKDCPWQS